MNVMESLVGEPPAQKRLAELSSRAGDQQIYPILIFGLIVRLRAGQAFVVAVNVATTSKESLLT